jgi:hypothetical protein
MAGRAGIWPTAKKKLHIGLDKTSPICYNENIKGKGETPWKLNMLMK